MASTLASLCLSQVRTFWTSVVTVNLFPLYLMNFMFHTMLDAAGIVRKVHYISMKCDVLFSQGSIRTLFRRGRHFSYRSKKISFSLQQYKNYKNRSRFHKVMITNVLPPFLWFTVYFSKQSQSPVNCWLVSRCNFISQMIRDSLSGCFSRRWFLSVNVFFCFCPNVFSSVTYFSPFFPHYRLRLVHQLCTSWKSPEHCEIWLRSEEKQFDRVLNNPLHALHQLLPRQSIASQYYNLRPRKHDKELPEKNSSNWF